MILLSKGELPFKSSNLPLFGTEEDATGLLILFEV